MDHNKQIASYRPLEKKEVELFISAKCCIRLKKGKTRIKNSVSKVLAFLFCARGLGDFFMALLNMTIKVQG
jgi:hypothetical protein